MHGAITAKKPAFVIDQIPESEPFPAFGTGRAGLE
jgi:hypothetical protein